MDRTERNLETCRRPELGWMRLVHLGKGCFHTALPNRPQVPSFLQREVERSPLPRHTLRPRRTAVPAYDTLYRSQAYTSTRKLACPAQAWEGAEELDGVGHIETYFVVSHEIRRGAFNLREAELYARLRLIAG